MTVNITSQNITLLFILAVLSFMATVTTHRMNEQTHIQEEIRDALNAQSCYVMNGGIGDMFDSCLADANMYHDAPDYK